MASGYVCRDPEAIVRPISTAATTIASENHPLISDFRRAFGMMKEIAVGLEKEKKAVMMKELEDELIQLLDAYEECTHFSTVMQSIGNIYKPGPQVLHLPPRPTDFKQLFKNETTKLKAGNSSNRQKHQFLRQFREAVWNVHHAGQPMPGEEQEDIVMSSTQCALLNIKCPVSGKPVTELVEPVCGMDGKYVYEKKAIEHHMKSSRAPCKCPISDCRGILSPDRVVCDALLLVDIEEQRSLTRETMAKVVEDFTELADD